GRVNEWSFFGAEPLTLYCAAPERELVATPAANGAWNIKYQFYRRGYSDHPDVTFPTGDKQANTTLTADPNWTRIMTGTGNYGRVYNTIADEATKVKSLYEMANFYDLFRCAV